MKIIKDPLIQRIHKMIDERRDKIKNMSSIVNARIAEDWHRALIEIKVLEEVLNG